MLKKLKSFAVIFCTGFLFTIAACAAPDGSSEDASAPSSVPSVSAPAENVPNDSPVSSPNDDPKDDFVEESPVIPQIRTVQYIRIKTNGLNVRAKASVSSARLGTVDEDVSMLCLGTENGFYKTYYKNKTAYVSANEKYTETFTLKRENDAVERAIEEGCKLIGTPYVYGAVRYHDGYGNLYKGFSVNKFDCSSLTQYVFFKSDKILLQVNTRTQIYQGKYVKKSDLARGDLIFFTNASRYNNKGIERVGHVAIYLGDNFILHTSSDYCKIEQVSKTRWNYYIEARRMVEA